MKKLIAAVLAGPYLLFALGYLMNAVVMAANHGQMPVLYPGGGCGPVGFFTDDLVHVCMTAATHLKFLGDWIAVVESGHLQAMASPGDFLELAYDVTQGPSLWVAVGLTIANYCRNKFSTGMWSN